MSQFSYGQYCPLAHALDTLGERWTLLIIRELMHGPRTYKLLLQNLPDMGAISLSRRLGKLERSGIVQREMQEPRAADEPYSLTTKGHKLIPLLVDLAAFGLESLDLPAAYEVYSPLWSLLELHARFKPALAKELNMMFELRIDSEAHHVEISQGVVKTHAGPAPSPLFVITTDAASFILILRGILPIREAIQIRRLDIDGSLAAFSRTLDIFGLRAPVLEAPKQPKNGAVDGQANAPKIEMYPAR
ncbi:MAG: helix-turn-helix domain-containing protein [Bacteroidota bacterium]